VFAFFKICLDEKELHGKLLKAPRLDSLNQHHLVLDLNDRKCEIHNLVEKAKTFQVTNLVTFFKNDFLQQQKT
jgi:hypothetical protein